MALFMSFSAPTFLTLVSGRALLACLGLSLLRFCLAVCLSGSFVVLAVQKCLAGTPELNTFFLFLDPHFQVNLDLKNLEMSYLQNCYSFDLISKLRARPKYQLSASIHSHKVVTKFAYKLHPSLVWVRFFFLINYIWLVTAVVSHS